MSELRVDHPAESTIALVSARGGTRRERGAVIGAWVRKNPGVLLVATSYSETYGFLTCTYMRYVMPKRGV